MRFENLSVVIPTYNRAQLLQRAINSICKQTVLPREIIIIDDGSEDATEQTVQNCEIHAGVSLIYQRQQNRGPAAARNKGVKRASFPIIAFLDSDDHWHKEKIRMQFQVLKNDSRCRISHTREKWLRNGKHLNQKNIHRPRGGNIFSCCTKLCCVGMSTIMLDRTIFDDYGLFDENLRCCEDYDFWLRVSLSEPFLLIDTPLTVKEGGRDDQVSVAYRVGMDKYRIYALEKILVQGNLTVEQEQEARNTLIKKCEIYGNGCLKHGKETEGLKILEIANKYRHN